MTAVPVIPFPAKRAAEAMPVSKLRVLEQVRRRTCEKTRDDTTGKDKRRLRRSALFVIAYLAEITDKESGLSVAELGTIADRTGYSRGEVCKEVSTR